MTAGVVPNESLWAAPRRPARSGRVVMVSVAGHYPQSHRPGLTAAAVPRFPETVKGRG